ncbi:Tyrosine-protein phosphatase non-receptor type 13 [Liparis tanakae]|uniref:Tyrosine-protein phosphatase non-receptor type 13 n=1 Tax=Liparis tanakae TaxID=230148 RepID=A0A4Z2GJ46_9TELE|nr:Tyrosine-protein phosphatase non-receptor type 13 [Liparis tanakae]
MDLGTIISSITAGGPADVNGSLRPGKPGLRDALPPLRPVHDARLDTCCDDSDQRQHVSHSCDVDAGDRLISVNDVNLNGLSHTTAVDILQNAPDDVTLVVLQPKENLYKESSSGYVPHQANSALKALSSAQRREPDADTSSEEPVGAGSPGPPLHSAGLPPPTSSSLLQLHSSFPDSRPSGVPKVSPLASRVQQCLERSTAAAAAAAEAKPHRAEPNAALDPAPPALPPKTRKAKVAEAPKVPEHSDWGDSDMDEETYSSSQEKLKVKKEHIMESLNGNAPGVNSLCPGELFDVELSKKDSSLGISVTTPMPSPRKQPVTQAESSLSFMAKSPPESQGSRSQVVVDDALERMLLKSPGRHNSYSDSTDGDEEVEEAFSTSPVEHSRNAWEQSVYHTPGSSLGPGRYDGTGQLDDTNNSAFYSPNLFPPSPVAADLESPILHMVSSPTSPSPDPLPPPLPLPLNLTLPGNGQDTEDFVPEVELKVSLVKSEKGSLGFTLTKGNDHGCYIHDIVQDPAKGDGTLRPGDRMITVNNTDVSNMGHTEVVNLVRAAPRVVDLVVGRVLEAPKPPIEAHLLPDIGFKGSLVLDGGCDSIYDVLFVRDVVPGSPAFEEGSLRALDLIHYINGAPTQELTLSESSRLMDLSLDDLTLKATRDGKPVSPGQKSVSFLNNNVSPKVSSSMNGFLKEEDPSDTESLAAICPPEEEIIHLDLEKLQAGGLGFSVIGGERGIFVKSITPGGLAETSRELQVNEELMTGVSHTKAVTTIRKAKGLVHLIVSRPPDQNPNTYLAYLPINSDKCNGNAGKRRRTGNPSVSFEKMSFYCNKM